MSKMADEVVLVEMEECVPIGEEETTSHNDLLQQNENSMDSCESLRERRSVPRAALTFMEVKSIVAASFGEDGRRCYKVHWRDSWVYDDHLYGCSELVEKFWKEQKKAKEKQEPKKRQGTKRASNGISTKDLSVIVIGNDHSKESQEFTLSTSTNSEVDGGDWMLDPDGVGTDEETKENDVDWAVGSQTKKIRPTGQKYTLSCHVCSQDFELVTAFKRHYSDQHPGVKPFACDMCDKRFDRKENLSRHIRIHTGDRRYVCNYCGKGYTDPSGLKKHVVAKHSGMKFSCNLCASSFKSKEALSRHLTKHLSDCRLNGKKDEHSSNKNNAVHNQQRTINTAENQSSLRKPLLETNTDEDASIVLMAAEEADQDMDVSGRIESETNNIGDHDDDESLKTTTESLQNVVDQLQQFVDAEGSTTTHQVVQYVQMSHGATTVTTTGRGCDRTSVLDADGQEALGSSSEAGCVTSGKQFIFTGETHHQIIPITMTSSPQVNLPISSHQMLPIVAAAPGEPNQSAQIITVPIATSQAFVYTRAMVVPGGTPPPNPSNVDH